jgi:hypothetical protein
MLPDHNNPAERPIASHAENVATSVAIEVAPSLRLLQGWATIALDVHPSHRHQARARTMLRMPRRLHRCYGLGYLHFITSSCYQRRPLLNTPRRRNLFLEILEQTRQRYNFVVVGYVVLPEHFHLMISEPERGKSFHGDAGAETALRAEGSAAMAPTP